MSTFVMSANMTLKKPPACDRCKARRVLCHSQPNGAPCPRCEENNVICTTTVVARGRPKRTLDIVPLPRSPSNNTSPPPPLLPQPVSKSPAHYSELTPEFVAHCFSVLQYTPQYDHPLLLNSSIMVDIRFVSFELDRLPPQSRVLALCLVCCASLTSFHPSVLGEGPRPESLTDKLFFSSNQNLLSCGVRRAPAYRALHAQVLKAAWDIGIIFEPSHENAASCWLLDMLEQCEFAGASRPFGDACIAHVRVLAPMWRSAAYTVADANNWAGHLMGIALTSVRSRTPLLFTPNDQLLLCGPQSGSLNDMVMALRSAPADLSLLHTWLPPYMYHVIHLCRELTDTIAGDSARINILSETAVINFLSSLSLMHTALSPTASPHRRIHRDARRKRISVCPGQSRTYFGLDFREMTEGTVLGDQAHDRLRLLRAQARGMAVLGLRELSRGIRYLPKIHFIPVHWTTIYEWAQFCAEEAEKVVQLSCDEVRDIKTFANELRLLGYSLDVASSPQATALIKRLDALANT
ncbi:Zn(2)-C6 fungal-type domain-containing protein [Mycena venus]|uniref:Zn(2)-C6 fungal-type domain-containing protein n=1 Tax=Mycena venus TaxID=2733690 RepID=A0A8H6XJ36_9AGAR|nr:Zn(2)-C6 fungal-type domain-containing protein [Mycena venus]